MMRGAGAVGTMPLECKSITPAVLVDMQKVVLFGATACTWMYRLALRRTHLVSVEITPIIHGRIREESLKAPKDIQMVAVRTLGNLMSASQCQTPDVTCSA